MEGAYNKVLEAGHSLPKEFHGFYLEQLNATVRWGPGQVAELLPWCWLWPQAEVVEAGRQDVCCMWRSSV